MPDYLNMTATEVLRHAKEQSGKTAEEIAEALGVSTAVVTRYFRSADSYGPGFDKLPRLCSALGNTILIDWLRVQTAQPDIIPAAKSRAEVLTAVARASLALGAVNKILIDAESTGIGTAQARALRSGLEDVKKACSVTQGMLEDLAAAQRDRDGILCSLKPAENADDYPWELQLLLSEPCRSSPLSRYISRSWQKKYIKSKGPLPRWFFTIHACLQVRILKFAMGCPWKKLPEDMEIPGSAIDPDAESSA